MSSWGLLRGIAAIPTVIVVQVLSFTLILASNIIFPVLGPGIGLLAAVGSLVGGLFFLGFARPPPSDNVEAWSRPSGGRAGPRCCRGAGISCSAACTSSSPCPSSSVWPAGWGEVTANPTFLGWVFVLAASVLHLGFMGGLAYRWIVAEPSVPEQPVKRRSASQRQPRGVLGPALSRRGPDRRNAAGRLRVRRRLDAELTRPGIARGVPAGFWAAASAIARAATQEHEPGRWRAEPGGGTNRKEGTMPVVTRRELLEGRYFGHQDQTLEPEDGPVPVRGALRDLHHRPREDAVGARGGLRARGISAAAAG